MQRMPDEDTAARVDIPQWDKYRAMYLGVKTRYACDALRRGWRIRPPWWWITLSRLMAVMMFSSGPNGTINHWCQACYNQKTKWLIRQQKASVPQVDFVKRKNGPLTAITGCMTLMNERNKTALSVDL